MGGDDVSVMPPGGGPAVAEAAEAAPYEYDLIVIGGGSGGLACAKEAADLGKKVALLDFVVPSPQGTTWGLGGTCVNVGCIPKKLMHQGSLLGESFADAKSFGWKWTNEGHNWEELVSHVQDHIGSTNFGYRTQLRQKKVDYINARGKFIGPHSVECTKRNGKVSVITGEKIVIAVGGRPNYPGVPGDKEFCVTSDDIFGLPKSPGKTLVIGASYIALECAGFLAGLGYDVTVAVRSIFLRGFDQEIANHIVGHMERHGVKFMRGAVPEKFEKDGDGRILASMRAGDAVTQDAFDTVLLAVGRYALTRDLGLESAGVTVNAKTGKIDAVDEQTNVPHIYAIGDVLESRQELTPVAIQAGRMLAQRLYNGSTKSMDYNTVATTVFTPLEYGCVGMAEEHAVEAYGEDNLEVYHTYFKPLEWQMNHDEHDGVAHREDNSCFIKVICHIPDGERVVGFHYVGPNAGEVTQGFAVAMKLGAKKEDIDMTVGIHPTSAENVTTLDVTKRSGQSPFKSGC